jgi:hypothetical protein
MVIVRRGDGFLARLSDAAQPLSCTDVGMPKISTLPSLVACTISATLGHPHPERAGEKQEEFGERAAATTGRPQGLRRMQESRVVGFEACGRNSLQERADIVPGYSKNEVEPTGCCDHDGRSPTDRE